MNLRTSGFLGRRRDLDPWVPPGQYKTERFPVLSAGRTQVVPLSAWQLIRHDVEGGVRAWDWSQFRELPSERITADIHCVTRWSKLGTTWTGVSLEVLMDGLDLNPRHYLLAECHGGYTTNLSLGEVLGKSWVAFEYNDQPLEAVHGGPARLLVPHLYFWKSAKWLRKLTISRTDHPGFWESAGYHNHGDPWTEERQWGD